MRMKKIFVALALVGSLACTPMTVLASGASATEAAAASFQYEHDPRFDSKAMEDIVVDKNAVYGFAPSPNSTRLAAYAEEDWSDPEKVAGWRQERLEYFAQFDSMYEMWKTMEAEGKSVEEIARAVSAERNRIRLASYEGNEEGLQKVKESNLATYGNENGPTPESLFEKYGSWEKVLAKSFSSNSGMDACLGLYDDRYEFNQRTEASRISDTIAYTVKKDDTLRKISGYYFGTTEQWKEIYNANRDQISNYNLIYPDQVFTIPVAK